MPLGCTDKSAAQTKLNELVRKAERQHVGLSDPSEDHACRPIAEHIADFKQHLRDQNNTEKYVGEVCKKVERVVEGCAIETNP